MKSRLNESSPQESVGFVDVYRDELDWVVSRREELRSPQRRESDDKSIDQKLEPSENASLHAAQEKALDDDLTGLAISGGGIRSATFALGVLQGLATAGLLSKFDYLSTVSGGGYIGSWLSAWIQRDGFDEVQEQLKAPGFRNIDGDDDPTPENHEPRATDIEPRQIRHLRQYTNFLAATPSLFSVDGWALIAIYLRNLLLNQVVLMLALLGVVIGARAIIEVYAEVHNIDSVYFQWLLSGCAIITGTVAAVGSAMVVRKQESTDAKSQYWVRVIIPWVVTAFLMTLLIVTPAWSRMMVQVAVVEPPSIEVLVDPENITELEGDIKIVGPLRDNDLVVLEESVYVDGEKLIDGEALAEIENNEILLDGTRLTDGELLVDSQALDDVHVLDVMLPNFFPAILLVFGIPILIIATLMGGLSAKDRPIFGAMAGFVGGAIGGIVICFAVFCFSRAGNIDAKYSSYVALASTLGIPCLLFLLVTISFFHVGLTGDQLNEVNREWWSAVNSRLMMIAAGWLVVMSVVVVGPWIFGSIIVGIRSGSTMQWMAGSVGWVGTILAGVWASRSEKTGGGKSKVRELLVKITPVAFLITVAMSVATIAMWLSYDIYAYSNEQGPNSYFLARVDTNLFSDFDDPIGMYGFLALIVSFAILLLTSNWLGDLVGVNRFTLQSLYANRLTRCYLGASHSDRKPQALVDFDAKDDLPFHKLGRHEKGLDPNVRPGPLHIVNTALNQQSGRRRVNADEADLIGKESALRSRQAESFIFTPLYCGSESTGYCDSESYSDGVSLGTAVALSGAAVSPNMGYHTSAPIRVLLTMFNVRLGGWHENPKRLQRVRSKNRRAGWQLLLAELAGGTSTDDDFVYLSDGGHFENVGVYELLRRRCRFILAVDSGPDPKFHDNVGRLIRQARIDFGVRIELSTQAITPDEKTGRVEQHFVVGRIHYGAVHAPTSVSNPSNKEFNYDNNQGVIVWIKSGVSGDESADLTTYHAKNRDFPYQSTFDLFYSEAQFESYRELGEHSVRELLTGVTFAEHEREEPAKSKVPEETKATKESKYEFTLPCKSVNANTKTAVDLSGHSSRALFKSLYDKHDGLDEPDKEKNASK